MKKEVVDKIIVWAVSLVLIGLEFYSITTNSHYKYDFIFLMLLLSIRYSLNKYIIGY